MDEDVAGEAFRIGPVAPAPASGAVGHFVFCEVVSGIADLYEVLRRFGIGAAAVVVPGDGYRFPVGELLAAYGADMLLPLVEVVDEGGVAAGPGDEEVLGEVLGASLGVLVVRHVGDAAVVGVVDLLDAEAPVEAATDPFGGDVE